MSRPDKGISKGEALAHWQTVDLLSRYAELLSQGQDAAVMYPSAAAHLAHCEACRNALAGLLTPSEPTPGSVLSPDALPFLSDPEPVQVIARPGSDSSSFGVHIALSGRHIQDALYGNLASGGSPILMRGYTPLQPGGRLLLFDDIALGDGRLQVLLTVESIDEEQGNCTIVGQLSGDQLPDRVDARLHIGDRVYLAEVCAGVVCFDQVAIDETVQHVTLSLETPD